MDLTAAVDILQEVVAPAEYVTLSSEENVIGAKIVVFRMTKREEEVVVVTMVVDTLAVVDMDLVEDLTVVRLELATLSNAGSATGATHVVFLIILREVEILDMEQVDLLIREHVVLAMLFRGENAPGVMLVDSPMKMVAVRHLRHLDLEVEVCATHSSVGSAPVAMRASSLTRLTPPPATLLAIN